MLSSWWMVTLSATASCELVPVGSTAEQGVAETDRVRSLVAASAGNGQREDVLALHHQAAGHARLRVIDVDFLNRLREAPDRAARLAGESLIDRKMPDVSARLVVARAAGLHEQDDADLVVVAEVVVPVVDHGQ